MPTQKLPQNHEILVAWLEEHPLSTIHEVAAGLGITHDQAKAWIQTAFYHQWIARQPAFNLRGVNAKLPARYQAVPR